MARKKSENKNADVTQATEAPEKKEAIKPEADQASDKKEPIIYVGPTLPAGLLSRYTIFRNGQCSPHIKQEFEKCHAVSRLMVPVSKLAEVERKLSDKTSSYAGWFAEIKKHYRKGA